MEGAIFVTGAAVQWLRDGLEIIADAAETGPLAASVPDSGGVFVVPAFTGLGSPWWDPYARGTIVGITRGTTRAHIARAVVEAMAFQTADVVERDRRRERHGAARDADRRRRVGDGPARASSRPTCSACPVRRAAIQETTALGAAFLAGLAEGVWDVARDRQRDVAAPTRRSSRDDAGRARATASPTGGARSSGRAAGRRPELSRPRSRARRPTSAYDATCATSVGTSSALRVAYVSTYS